MIGNIVKIDEEKKCFYIRVPYDKSIKDKRCKVSFIKENVITNLQRKKIYALINDIAIYTGYPVEIQKLLLKLKFMEKYNIEELFSLSTTTKETAKIFITFLVDFVLKHNIPCTDSLIVRCEDIDRYLYSCLFYKSCAVCGKKPVHLHHVDPVGSRGNRRYINHLGLRAMALCPEHHAIYHNIGEYEFNKRYHCYGIKLNSILCQIYNLSYFGESEF